jgi:ComF family protein
LWSYRPPIDSVIQGLKFSRLTGLARPLGEALADRLLAVDSAADLVSWVPLHWRRRLTRSFDQAEEIAAAVAKRLDLRLSRTLVRRRSTVPQSRLSRSERKANPTSAFRPARRAEIVGRRILLIDDVATTGATLAAAAKCLKRFGAAAVSAAVVARTPLEDPAAETQTGSAASGSAASGENSSG